MAEKGIKLKLEVDSTKGTAQVKKTSASLKKLGTTGAKAADKLSKGFAAAAAKMKLLAVGMAASAAAMGYMAKKVLDNADATAKLADSLGYNIKLMQEYSYAAGLSGVAQSTLNSSMLAFTKRLGEAKAGSGALVGYLKKTDKALLNQLTSATDVNQALEIFMNALGNVKGSTERAALAAAAFSRAGIAMTVMVKDGGGALRAMQKEAHDLGLVLGGDLFRNAEVLNDSMSKVSQVIKILFTKAVLTLSPEIDKVVKKMVKWVGANQDLIDQKTEEAIKEIGNSIKSIISIYEALPDGVIGAAGVGILGRILFGGKVGLILATVYLINTQLEKIDSGASTIIQDFKDIGQIMDDMMKRMGKISGGFTGTWDTPSDTDPKMGKKEPWLEKQLAEMEATRAHTTMLEELEKNIDKQRLERMITDADAEINAIIAKNELEKAVTLKANDEKTTLMKDFYTQYNALGKTQLQLDIEAIKAQAEIWINAGLNKIEIEKWTLENIRKLREDANAKLNDLDKDLNAKLLEGIENWSKGFANTLNDMLWGAETTFADIAKSFGKMITQMLIQEAMLTMIGSVGGGGILGFLGGSAKGNVFEGGKMLAYAKGGIVNKPTIFPMKRGYGLMGEAGPEAILPLQRGNGGKLGVAADIGIQNQGQQPVQVILNNPVFQDLETQRQVMIQIASVVASQVAPGAVVENYDNDGEIRRTIRGGI